MITNKFNLPDAIVRAVQNDGYSRGESDYSATSLLKPPRILALTEKHKDEIEEDASERIWSLLGQATHAICERANVSDLVEKRFFARFSGKTVSAQIDSLGLETDILTDYKVTTVYKCRPNSPPDADWVAQLNIQLELLRQNGRDAKALRIVAILRDWSKNMARREDNYPELQVATIPIEVWPREKTVKFINERIRLHEAAKLNLEKTLCSKEERWAKDAVFAVMKKGQKKAVKLFDDHALARSLALEMPGCFVEVRPGASTRCELYCSVNRFCNQYKSEKGAN